MPVPRTYMRPLLTKWAQGTLARIEEARLHRLHQRHFLTRLRDLDSEWFPGREKTPEAFRSLCWGALAAFQSERTHRRKTPFQFCVDEGLHPEGFLYRWPRSATLAFLRRNGGPELQFRLKVLRNLDLALPRFPIVGLRQGESLHWLPNRPPPQRVTGPVDPALVPLWRNLNVPALLERSLLFFGQPMSRAELHGCVLAAMGVRASEPEPLQKHPESAVPPSAEALILAKEVEARVRTFWRELSAEEKELLRVRRWGEPGHKKPSWEWVAHHFGHKSPEHWRRREKPIMEALRAHFDPEEGEIVAETLAALIRGEVPGFEPMLPPETPNHAWRGFVSGLRPQSGTESDRASRSHRNMGRQYTSAARPARRQMSCRSSLR